MLQSDHLVNFNIRVKLILKPKVIQGLFEFIRNSIG